MPGPTDATAREYVINQNPKPAPDGYMHAIVREPARIVCDHFAIRMVPTYHPAGEGMMCEAFILDHIASGLAALKNGAYGPLSWATEDQCEAFAMSLASVPVNWASAEADRDIQRLGREFSDFVTHARRESEQGRSVVWGR